MAQPDSAGVTAAHPQPESPPCGLSLGYASLLVLAVLTVVVAIILVQWTG